MYVLLFSLVSENSTPLKLVCTFQRSLTMTALFETNCLRKIVLNSCGVDNDMAQAIGRALKSPNQPLRELHLDGNRIGADGMISLSHNLNSAQYLTKLSLKSKLHWCNFYLYILITTTKRTRRKSCLSDTDSDFFGAQFKHSSFGVGDAERRQLAWIENIADAKL